MANKLLAKMKKEKAFLDVLSTEHKVDEWLSTNCISSKIITDVGLYGELIDSYNTENSSTYYRKDDSGRRNSDTYCSKKARTKNHDDYAIWNYILSSFHE